MRDDVQNLKDSIPRALNNQKELTDSRLRDVNTELKSLKTLITQRMNPTTTPAAPASTSIPSYMRPLSGVTTPAPAGGEAADVIGTVVGGGVRAATAEDEQPKRPEYQSYASSPAVGRSSPFNSGMPAGGAKASIPAWQMAMSKGTSSASTPATATNGVAAGASETQEEAAPVASA